jgi:hypothetical protein
MSIRMLAPPGHTPPRTRRRRTALVPAAARPRTTLTDKERALNGDAIEVFTSGVGGRAKLRQVLSIAGAEAPTEKVVNCLLDPAYDTWSLRRICEHTGITVVDLFAHYKKGLYAAAHIRAAHLITEKLVPVVVDVMQRAVPHVIICPRCHATPTTPGTSACPECNGTGKVESVPDLQRQKLALELGRLIERKAGVVMQQTAIGAVATTALTSGHAGSLEQLQQAVGELLFSPARRRTAAPVVDVTPEPAAPEADDDRVSP